MKKFLSILTLLGALCAPNFALAQAPTRICLLQTGGGCWDVGPTNPFPVSATVSIGGFQANGGYGSLTATASTSSSTVIPTGTPTTTSVRLTNNGTAEVSCTFATGSATGLISNTQIPAGASVVRGIGSYDHVACINQTGSASNVVILESGTGLGVDSGGGSSGSGTVAQGTAAAITAGWPVIDGAGADTTGTFTGTGAATINANVDGYSSAKVQIKGTYATFTVNTLVSSDGGTTFVPLQCATVDGNRLGTTFLLTANQSLEIACGHQSGDDTLQLQTSAGPATGTANVDISPSAFPSNDGNTTLNYSKSSTYASGGTNQFALAVATNTTLTVPSGATCAYITVETANVRRTSDGTGATTTNGTLFNSGAQWSDCGPLAAYKFTAVSGSPTLDVEYFK